MSDAIVFLGPTLPVADAREILAADYRPPVAQGDVLRAVMDGARAIGIVDGFFENVPSVWHKEILFALTKGVQVYGSASMGALRAAELHAFGMHGVGAVFEAFADGRLEDDDEVAVTHGPAEIGYPILSEAMVNIRRTLSDAFARGIVGTGTRRHLEAMAKALPYKERTYARLFREAAAAGVNRAEVEALRAWLPTGRADQKREDAVAMLRTMREALDRPWTPATVLFPFEHTTLFERAARPILGAAA
ncbi:TfuA-like protein [Rhodocista pekingensis]|uniref:TfuA-like protein n=1 Tax=Rhodocista pekingensis TaxID=201185 RepID=A0ABW2KY43_9PROT